MASIEVTSVTVRLFSSGDDKLKAFASIVLNNAFIIKDLKVIEGNNGRFVAMPSRRGKDGVFHDIAHPLSQPVRDTIERIVLDAYEKEIAQESPRVTYLDGLES
jgi:stage V sporulation protein G